MWERWESESSEKPQIKNEKELACNQKIPFYFSEQMPALELTLDLLLCQPTY